LARAMSSTKKRQRDPHAAGSEEEEEEEEEEGVSEPRPGDDAADARDAGRMQTAGAETGEAARQRKRLAAEAQERERVPEVRTWSKALDTRGAKHERRLGRKTHMQFEAMLTFEEHKVGTRAFYKSAGVDWYLHRTPRIFDVLRVAWCDGVAYTAACENFSRFHAAAAMQTQYHSISPDGRWLLCLGQPPSSVVAGARRPYAIYSMQRQTSAPSAAATVERAREQRPDGAPPGRKARAQNRQADAAAFSGLLPAHVCVAWTRRKRTPTLACAIHMDAGADSGVSYLAFGAKRRLREVLGRQNVPDVVAAIVRDYADSLDRLDLVCGPIVHDVTRCHVCARAVFRSGARDRPLQAHLLLRLPNRAFACTACGLETCDRCAAVTAGRCRSCLATNNLECPACDAPAGCVDCGRCGDCHADHGASCWSCGGCGAQQLCESCDSCHECCGCEEDKADDRAADDGDDR